VRRLVLLLTTLVVVVAGCAGTPVTGTPSPAPSTAAPGAGPARVELPPRPRELPLDGVDPCALLTEEQRAELGLDGRVRPGTSDAPLFTGPDCTIVGYEPRGVGVSLTLATRHGLDELIAPGSVRDELTATDVVGFPAVVARPKQVEFCSVDVDLAEGQFLDVQFSDAARNPPIPQDQLCRDAVEIAEAAVTTLQAG
jgi:uncharacterized protein DUF3558